MQHILERIDNKTVRAPNFIVSVPDMHHVIYTEGEKVATVQIEGGIGRRGEVDWLVHSETLNGWKRPYTDAEMPSSKRQEILRDVSKSLDLLEMRHTVV